MDWGQLFDRIGGILNFQLVELGGQVITAGSILISAVVVFLTFRISRIVQRVVAAAARARSISDEGTVATLQSLARYVTLVLGFGIAVETLGFDITTLIAAGTVVAVAFGFAMQSIAQNFVSGVILLSERSITPTDVLEVEGTIVRVQDVGIRSTIARTRDDEELIIPNSSLVQSTVKNYTLRDSLFRIRSAVGVAYDSEMHRVQDVLLKAAHSMKSRSAKRDPIVLMTEFGDSAVNFEVSIWVEDPWFSGITQSKLNFQIWDALKAAGITIAFPQLDVHVKQNDPGLL